MFVLLKGHICHILDVRAVRVKRVCIVGRDIFTGKRYVVECRDTALFDAWW